MAMMKAAIYYGPGDMRIEEIKRPEAGVEGVVVKVKACGVCPIMDLDAWFRAPSDGRGVGLARGHEWSGEIVEIGSKVNDFEVGDRIYMEPVFRPCNSCESCRQKDFWRCSNWMEGMGIHQAFAEYILLPFVSKDAVIKLPDSLSFRDLAMVEPLCLAVGLAKKANPDDVVVVLGQELVGLGTLAALKKRGVAKVITSDISKKHLDASKDVGADVAVNMLSEDIVDVVMQETGGIGADVVILTDHRPVALTKAINTAKRAGIVWLAHAYGSPFKLGGSIGTEPRFAVGADFHGFIEQPISFDPALLYMRTAWGTLGERLPRFKEGVELMESGTITAEKLVTHIFPLDKITEAFEIAANPHESIEVMVEP